MVLTKADKIGRGKWGEASKEISRQMDWGEQAALFFPPEANRASGNYGRHLPIGSKADSAGIRKTSHKSMNLAFNNQLLIICHYVKGGTHQS